MLLPVTAAGVFAVASLAAQGAVPPYVLGQTTSIAGLNAWAPGVQVRHVHFVHLPGNPPEVFYGVANVRHLPTALGGVGDWDLVAGRYDVVTDTFSPTLEAAPLNQFEADLNLTLHHSGRHAVFGRETGPLARTMWLATRPAIGQPWQVVGPIQSAWASSAPHSRHPALVDDGGQPFLLHTHGGRVARSPIDLAVARLTAPPTIVANPTGNVFAEAPFPVTAPNGELIGFALGERSSFNIGSIDLRLALDLDPNTPSTLVHHGNGGSLPGGHIGGRFFAGQEQSGVPSLRAIETCWFTGGRAPIGGTLVVRMYSPPTAGPELYLTAFVASSHFLAAGVPMPPLQGLVGIEPASAWTSPLFVHDNRNGEAQATFAIPNVAALSGARLPAQCATIEATTGALYLGNTAWLRVD